MSLYRDLKRLFDEDKILHTPLQRHAYARDASFYRLLPRLVLRPATEEDIQALFAYAREAQTPMVFRAGGTNLSGQAVSDHLLVEVRKGWQAYQIHDAGETITLQPGVLGSRANMALAPYDRILGPDPGSLNAALIGGIVANNASGIRSGIHWNPYHTLVSLRAVLPNGHILDSAHADADKELKRECPHIHDGLLAIRGAIHSQPALKKRIEHKYRIKNTMGYALNAFLDFESPAQILAHLLVGSEGTLGFISDVTLRTRPLMKYKASALLIFPSLETAIDQVEPLKEANPAALELLDASALQAMRDVAGLPESLVRQMDRAGAALIIDLETSNAATLRAGIQEVSDKLQGAEALEAPRFETDATIRERLWKVRRELGPLYAGRIKPGTTLISEDICFPIETLAAGTRELKDLLAAFGYDDAVIFGHAGDGNLHFKLSIDFQDMGARERYRAFMEKLAGLVIDIHDGSLKAEHGTGRNMAPFLEREWGTAAVALMRRIKNLLDPEGLLNPNVIFSDDPLIHLKHMKQIPLVDEKIDACIECGLCEPNCPSSDLTLSARQRITVLREMQTLANGDHSQQLQARGIQKAFSYYGVQTCAGDGLCSLSCPLDINTGQLMKAYQAHTRSRLAGQVAIRVNRWFAAISRLIRVGLRITQPINDLWEAPRIRNVSIHLHRVSLGLLPAWSRHLRAAAGRLPVAPEMQTDREVVYFPSCLTRTLSENGKDENISLAAAFMDVMTAARIRVHLPGHVEKLCCGLAFQSKGFPDAALQSAVRLVDQLYADTGGGEIPVVVDTSPCSRFVLQYDQILAGVTLAKWRQLRIMDITEYLHDEIVPRLQLKKVPGEAVLHPTCSTRELGLVDKMRAVAEQCAEEVTIPIHAGCCGFAGDRGLQTPELTEAATRLEAEEIQSATGDAGFYSTSRTCEIGMSEATGREFHSLVHLVRRALRS